MEHVNALERLLLYDVHWLCKGHFRIIKCEASKLKSQLFLSKEAYIT